MALALLSCECWSDAQDAALEDCVLACCTEDCRLVAQDIALMDLSAAGAQDVFSCRTGQHSPKPSGCGPQPFSLDEVLSW